MHLYEYDTFAKHIVVPRHDLPLETQVQLFRPGFRADPPTQFQILEIIQSFSHDYILTSVPVVFSIFCRDHQFLRALVELQPAGEAVE